MAPKSEFRQELEEAIGGLHLANHPMYLQWAEGTLSKRCLMGTLAESWHWITGLVPAAFYVICSKAPQDVADMELDNISEELNPENPHPQLFLRFIKACGYDPDEITKTRALPSTEAWLNWQLRVVGEKPWQAGVAATHVGSEFQAVGTMTKVLPALREKYKFAERDIEHFWVHSQVDVKHSTSAFDLLERHCTTRELKDMARHYVRESARMKWFFTDGIYLHYEKGELNYPN